MMRVGSWTDIEEQVRSRTRSEQLYRLTSNLAAAVTTRAVSETVRDGATQTLGCDSTTLYLWEERDKALVVTSTNRSPEELRGFERIPLEAPYPVAAAARERRPFFIESREALVAASPRVAAANNASSFNSWALIPITGASGNRLGLLAFAFQRPMTFSEQDRQLMTAVAEQCAVALDRARAYDSEAAALRKKDEFLAMLGHELRNPLAPIITATHLIPPQGHRLRARVGNPGEAGPAPGSAGG